ncbi:MAG: hypothetical protein NDI61_07985 [Bdellovibrionaceae bacterium]|nr:hypothetical protein [Pseudobdellovibrionaceae bacterium]
MNSAHFHLLVNHVPLIAIPVAVIFLLHSLWCDHLPSRRFAYLVLMVAAFSVIPVFLTGEPAEEMVEHLPGFSEEIIEPHEDSGKIAMILTILSGVAALGGFMFGERANKKVVRTVVVVMAVVAMISLGYTANLGGKIKHDEIRGDLPVAPVGGTQPTPELGD